MTAVDGVPARPSLGRDYLKLWSSSAFANLADGIFVVALPLMAVSLTTSPALVAGVSIAGRLPWLVFVLIAGALADRLDRRVTMRNVQVMRVLVLGTLAVLAVAGQLSLPVLYVAAFILGVGETLFDTAAQSIMPNLVPRELLSVANGRLYAVELAMNQFVGPPLGGAMVAISVPLALGGSTLAYALAAVGLALIVGTFRAESVGARPSMLAEIREGLGYLCATASCARSPSWSASSTWRARRSSRSSSSTSWHPGRWASTSWASASLRRASRWEPSSAPSSSRPPNGAWDVRTSSS
jgi:MFS family permease